MRHCRASASLACSVLISLLAAAAAAAAKTSLAGGLPGPRGVGVDGVELARVVEEQLCDEGLVAACCCVRVKMP